MTVTISNFVQHVEIDLIPCPVLVIKRQILNSLITFCERTRILTKEFQADISALVPAAATQNSMDVDISAHLTQERPVSVILFNLDGTVYLPLYRELENTLDDSIWQREHNNYTMYFSFEDNTTIRIYDRRSSDKSLYMKIAVKPLRSATAVQSILYEDWLDVIISGTKYRTMMMPGKEWSDLKAAREHYIEWKRGISRARLQVIKGRTHNSLRVRPRGLFGMVVG